MLRPHELPAAHFELFFHVKKSIRYHDRRRGYFQFMRLATNAVALLLAGVAFTDLSGDASHWWFKLLAAIAGLLAIFDVVVRFDRRQEIHGDLRRRFCELEANMLKNGLDDGQWREWANARSSIEADEPRVFRVLEMLSHNETARALGVTDAKEFNDVSWPQRITAHFWPWENASAKPLIAPPYHSTLQAGARKAPRRV
jgi:hypothetical protein